MTEDLIQIIEENSEFIVLNKASGLSVHNQSPSVAELLAAKKLPLHFVNRLDQDTSGLMLVAKKPELHQKLSESLTKGQKLYRALLRSPWKNPSLEVVWNWPLTDKAEGRMNPQGKTADRVAAETRVKIIRQNRYFTEITAEIKTGRQHQIRKHAALSGHPLVGDKRYNEDKYNRNIEKFYGQSRLCLHAEKIIFNLSDREYSFVSPVNFDLYFKPEGA